MELRLNITVFKCRKSYTKSKYRRKLIEDNIHELQIFKLYSRIEWLP